MCEIGRAFLPQHPTLSYDPSPEEFMEMVTIYLGAPSPAAAAAGLGRPVASSRGDRDALPLDRWGFALCLVHAPGDHWRVHHDTITRTVFTDVKQAGIPCRTEAADLFSDLLPRVLSGSWPQARKGLVPDAEITSDLPPTHPAILRRLMEMKVIHFGRSHYPSRRILQGSAGACANHRANTIPGEYERAARKLDARFHAVHTDEETRPVLSRLRGFGGPHGLCVGAFSETSDSLRLLLRVTANCAAERHWREAGAVSQQAALSVFTATYRRGWGATFALAGARLRLARRELVGATQTRRAAPRAGVFHPGRHADFTRAERPIDRGLPRGQRVHTD
jgi:hypothetical protein